MIKKKHFIFSFEYDVTKHTEKNTMPTETIPDETLTIRQILQKHQHGINVADQLSRQPLYEENPNFDSPDMQQMAYSDLTEQEDVLRDVSEIIKESRDKRTDYNKKVQQEASKVASQDSSEADEPQEPPKTPPK